MKARVKALLIDEIPEDRKWVHSLGWAGFFGSLLAIEVAIMSLI